MNDAWMKCVWIVLLAGLATLRGDGRQEADAFLRGMPVGLQDRQAQAVRMACQGDCEQLQRVRSSRNNRPAMPVGVQVKELPGGHRLYRPTAAARKKLPLLIYFHGGGWAFGSVNSCARFCAEVCAHGHVLVLGVHYRLAPEHPYPKGLEDCLEAVALARKQAEAWGGSPRLISLGGDSAGGNLALATAMRLGTGIRSLVLFYPVVKAWNDQSASWRKYQKGYGLDGRLMDAFNRAYVGGRSPKLPGISPACAPDQVLRTLPAVLQINAERDILHDQGLEFVQRLKRLKVPVIHRVLPGSVHLFVTVPGQDIAFRQAVGETIRFLTVAKCPEK